ncbi:methionine--tRNA ligase [Adhaeribacter pallidiroseus]|uniref:Methionine--tRNA ligase n=1 Tax=Adhaeribacter pallidiroseus TaxID=2072847 RepID=A0A369QN52_9BACT|nr:methionine--tRNA ligase [Adhaeribacter pallidiroseus]RDC64289.1 Methionine--tRNA ligase [Adhaeribacter pallidiroseus]
MNTAYKRYTITAALPYANGPVHIGHLAGVYIPADIYARYLRSKGADVKFVCGSDEHGVPITIRAQKEGITPQEIVDKYHNQIKNSFADFHISFDIYSRTSNETHRETASGFFTNLHEKGVFEEKTSQQYFDEKSQQFLADRYIVGTCPRCGNENAYGDQCEKCGSSLSPTELINPKSMLSGEPPVLKETKHWYLPLDKYEDWLREWIVEGHKNDWKTNVYGQCKSWIDGGLQPRAVTRDLDWGVPVPLEEAQGKVLYVWFDAPIGYISATKDLTPDWKTYWQDPETKLVHFIGKDNIVFHCIIFPVMLKAHGDYILPDNVPANEFLNLEGDKISTSRNWAVWLHEYLQDFPGKGDVLRYVLCANAPENKDNDFTWKDFQARNNNELLAIFGNFVNRALVLTHKYFNGQVPEKGALTDLDREVLSQFETYPDKVAAALEQYRFKEALQEVMNLARLGNKYLADTEPWKIIKTDETRVKTILNIALQIAGSLSILIEPFLPTSAQKLADMLNIHLGKWYEAGMTEFIIPGHSIGEAKLLFEKIEDATVEAQVQKLLDTKQANILANSVAAPAKENISFDDFSRMDIRIGTILEAEKVAKTKKLLKLKIDTGLDQRTIVSGIAEYFIPEAIIGQQVAVLVNLAPREIKGIQSQGMILMAENADGSLAFVQPSAVVKNGGTVS